MPLTTAVIDPTVAMPGYVGLTIVVGMAMAVVGVLLLVRERARARREQRRIRAGAVVGAVIVILIGSLAVLLAAGSRAVRHVVGSDEVEQEPSRQRIGVMLLVGLLRQRHLSGETDLPSSMLLNTAKAVITAVAKIGVPHDADHEGFEYERGTTASASSSRSRRTTVAEGTAAR